MLKKGSEKVLLWVVVFSVLLSLFAFSPGISYAAYSPSVNANPTLAQEDVVVYTENVLDFGADNTGNNDCTTAFQNAIDEAYSNNGGIVYVPAGRYKFNGTLLLKRKVTLRGEWRNPDSNPTAAGTILMPYANKDNEGGTSFIRVCSNAGLKDLGIWYPEQSFSSVHAYPWTVSDGAFDSDDRNHHGFSVQNVTFYNSYKGMITGTTGGASQEPRLLNVYGTFLKYGYEITACYNFAASTNFYASSKYWINSGLAGAPAASADQTTLKNYMRANLTAMYTYAHVDGFMSYNTVIEDANIGIYGNGGWCYYYNSTMTNVNKGVYINGSNNIDGGVAQQFIGGNISVLPGAGHYGIEIPNLSQVDIIGVTIGGSPEACVYGHDGARLNLSQMNFNGWSSQAIRASGKSLQVLDSRFNQTGTHIYLGSTIKGASILGNTWTGTRTISNNTTGTVNVDDTSLNLPQMPNLQTAYTVIPLRKPANPGNFYNIASYGAVQGGSADCTTAVQNALNAAASAGGGTVFVPAGYWKVTTLTIPSNVHLRGVGESVGCGDNRGSTLFATSGQGSPDGTACVTMNANSGIFGINFYYPNIGTSRSIQYSPAIRGNGSGIYIRNVSVGNAWRGVDLYTNRCDNFEVSGVWGNPRDYGIYVGGGSQNGKLENNMFAWTGDAAESTATAYPGGNNRPFAESGGGTISTVGRPFVFANSTGVVGFQNFVFCPKGDTNAGLKFVNNGGGPNNLKLIQSITDQSQGFEAQAGDNISILGLSCSWGGSWTESTFSGTINVFGYNANCLDGSNDGLDDSYIWNRGGTVNIVNGSSTLRPGNTSIKFDAGTTVVAGVTDCNSNAGRNIVSAAAGITSAKVIGCAAFGPITAANNAGGKLTMAYNVDLFDGPEGYTWCASEGGSFTLPATSDVAYGANGSYYYMYGKSGRVTFNTATFGGDPIPNTVKSGYYRISGPTGYTWCANENGSFTLPGACDIAYGANGSFIYQTNKTGTVTFNNATFGDPIANVPKAGFYKPAGETNKALNKSVTASSTINDASWKTTSVVDGQRSSVAGAMGWTSANSTSSNHTEWVQVDLGSASSISRVDLYPRNDSPNTGYGFPVDFTIQVSTDNLNWSTVVTKTGYALPAGSVQSFGFNATNARYVKVNGTSLRQNPNDGNLYRMQFAEVEVY